MYKYREINAYLPPFAFAWSAKNCAKPLSVNGCFKRDNMALNGPVITSAPISAQLIMCMAWRTDAAKIWVS